MEALENIRVLDLTRLLPGPYCSMVLGDFGAEVIKIEEPETGDYARMYAPLKNGMGYRHIILNRNKKSLTLNLKTEEGKEIFYKLAKNADVIIESFRPGVVKRLGIDYEAISSFNPRIIYCSMSGFGQTGPYKLEAGHDLNYVSLAGITSLTGEKNGKPYIPGIQIADITGGLKAVIGILLALNNRNRTNRGQYIDISLHDAALAMLPSDASIYFGSGEVTERGGSRLTGQWPNYNIYRTKDNEYLAVGALEEKFWVKVCKAINREDIIHYVNDREKWEVLSSILEEIFAGKTRAEWEKIFAGSDACVTPVKKINEAFSDPHAVARGMVVDLVDEELGNYKQMGTAIKLSDTPGQLKTRAPLLGEHTAQILSEIGIAEKDIKDLKNKKII